MNQQFSKFILSLTSAVLVASCGLFSESLENSKIKSMAAKLNSKTGSTSSAKIPFSKLLAISDEARCGLSDKSEREKSFSTNAFADYSSKWNQEEVDVCWVLDSKNFELLKQKRDWVRLTVLRNWEHSSGLRFSGWGMCAPWSENSRGIRIGVDGIGEAEIEDEDVLGFTRGVGREINGHPTGMVLSFSPFRKIKELYKEFPAAEKEMDEVLIQSIALHEFGHAIGFEHEHVRPDKPTRLKINSGIFKDSYITVENSVIGDSFTSVSIYTSTQPYEIAYREKECENTKHRGSTAFGVPWDIDSVMNYCNPLQLLQTELSDGDVLAVSKLYPAKKFLKEEYDVASANVDFNADSMDDTTVFVPDPFESTVVPKENKKSYFGVTHLDFEQNANGLVFNPCLSTQEKDSTTLQEGIHSMFNPVYLNLCIQKEESDDLIIDVKISKTRCGGDSWFSAGNANLNQSFGYGFFDPVIRLNNSTHKDGFGNSVPYYLCYKKIFSSEKSSSSGAKPLSKYLKDIQFSEGACPQGMDQIGPDITARLGRIPWVSNPKSRVLCAEWGR